ncbi:MAG: DUF4386 domain-containing protein [Thermoanaerobaculia bacterium]|nr:DUF4386 domain-containing protein [Thermoanaerobaculia bacterium]
MSAASPKSLARLAGALYLVIIVFGLFGEMFVRGELIVWGDPTATAERILASESLWRFGAAANLFYLLCAVIVSAILLVLLRPVSRDVAWLAVFFNLVAIAVEAAGRVHLVSALATLRATEALAAFTPAQVHALAYVALQAHGRSFSVALLFFGGVCLAFGWLIYRSGFLPRLIGAGMAIAGLGYLLDGFALILSPALHAAIFPFSLLPAFVAESSLCLWLLVKGVDVAKWEALSRSRAAPDAAAGVGT